MSHCQQTDFYGNPDPDPDISGFNQFLGSTP